MSLSDLALVKSTWDMSFEPTSWSPIRADVMVPLVKSRCAVVFQYHGNWYMIEVNSDNETYSRDDVMQWHVYRGSCDVTLLWSGESQVSLRRRVGTVSSIWCGAHTLYTHACVHSCLSLYLHTLLLSSYLSLPFCFRGDLFLELVSPYLSSSPYTVHPLSPIPPTPSTNLLPPPPHLGARDNM